MKTIYLKSILTLLISSCSLLSCFSQTYLTSQADVDAFDSSTITLSSDLVIRSTSSADPIVNLSNLINLTSIGGKLTISLNPILTNLDELSNLTSVGGDLNISYNGLLINLDGLSSLTAIGGGLNISYNASVINLDALSSLTSVGGGLNISHNASLVNLDGLSSLTAVGGFLFIVNNTSLINLDGLSNIISIGLSLDISNNNSLVNIDGLGNITSVEAGVIINSNASLINLNGLVNVTSVGGGLFIVNNTSLSNCCAIQELLFTPNSIGNLITIHSNPSECSSEEEIISATCQRIQISINLPCIDTENGSIQVQITNGIVPFTYTWQRIEDGQTGNGSTSEFNFIIENLGAGTYDLTVTDTEGTVFVQENIILTPIPGSVFEIIEITTTNSSNGINNGAIHLIIAGGTAPYNLSWSGLSSGTQTNINEPTFTIPLLSQGEYEITVSDNVGNQQTVAITLLDETVPVFPCTQPLDIVILNDVSGSVDAVEYNESKQFFVDFINEVNIGTGPNDSRVAIIEWSSGSEQNIQIPITDNIAALQNYVNYSRTFNGGTNPHEALNFGENYLTGVARVGVERVLILSTDGSGGQISPSLIALADQYKAAGYHIITIAFDAAFANSYTRNILRQVASIDLLAPGAPAYSLLDENLAANIVQLYLCPIDPGNSATAYFNRDGAIEIIGMEVNGGCPTPNSVELTFSIAALRELSIPLGTPVTFYYNDPALFGATSILTWQVPCAIPAGTSETFTVTLPITGAANIFAVLNNDDSQSSPITFPITNIDELAYSNNISDTTICVDLLPTLQAFKYSTTPLPICNNMVMYTVDVCNIADSDAIDVLITDDAPDGFILLNSVVNDNGCSTDNGGSFDIPGGCCVSITYTYDASDAVNGNYNDQDVQLSGPINQVYLDFDGANTALEDVLIDGTIDCPSTIINFIKSVNVTDICEDAFVVYTFTIDNQLNVPLQGLLLTDILPTPVTWVFQPYNLHGLSISNSTFDGGSATFIIDEVDANTVASFSIDAALGDWTTDGDLNNTASLENVPNLENGGIQTLNSNTVSTHVSAKPEIEVTQTFNCSDNTIDLAAILNGQTSTAWSWVTTGDGIFDDNNMASTIYNIGNEELANGEIILSITGGSNCGEINETVEMILEAPDSTGVNLGACEGYMVDYNGTSLSIGDTQNFTFQDSNGCDSIVSVTVLQLPSSNEHLTMKISCIEDPINYNGDELSIGDQKTYVFENMHGCDSLITVNVISKSELDEKDIMPNAFSPNSDGANDCFHPYFSDALAFQNYKLQIFNRWGDFIFSTTDVHACWDGTFNNKPLNTGVYVWHIEMTTAGCEGVLSFAGDVTLMR